MELRWYQEEARDSIWHYFNDGGTGNPVVALPTGTGKSVVIGDFVKQMMLHYEGLRIIKLTHVKELIQQNFDKLLTLWPLAPAGVYSAGLGRREHAHPVTFAGIASVARKADLFGRIDFVLIDECHLLGPSDSTQYQQFIGDLKCANPDLKVIGFTATPYRLGQGHLTEPGSIFSDICYDLTSYDGFARLIAEGYLCPLVARPPGRSSASIDVSGISTSAGDYNQKQLQAAVDKYEITKAAVEEMLEYGQDRNHWLVFAAGVDHAIHVADCLNARGVKSIAIHSKMGDAARDEAIARWKAGAFQCAVNNNILTTGIDFPAIDLIGHLQPTKSPGRWVQGLGRGTRPSPGKKNCLVLDFAGNTARLGTIDDPVLPKAKGKKGGGEAPVKLCPACGCFNHTRATHCTSCGHEFAVIPKIQETASTLEVMTTNVKVETFAVHNVTYEKYQPTRFIEGRRVPDTSRPPSMKVCYDCGVHVFKEYVSLEHPKGIVRHKARDWWRAHTGCEPPDTVDEALLPQWQKQLAQPTHIQVWVNAKYPEVMAHCYDGTAFGEDKVD